MSKNIKKNNYGGLFGLFLFFVLIYTIISLDAISQANSGLRRSSLSEDIINAVSLTDLFPDATVPVTSKTAASRPSLPDDLRVDITVPYDVFNSSAVTVNVSAATHTTTDVQLSSTGETLTVISDKAKIRSGAGTEFEIIGTPKKDEKYELIAIRSDANGVLWFLVKLEEDHTGYICENYVSYTGMIPNGKVYLTFDDGPSENTGKILDILDRYNVKATFFVKGNPQYKDLYGEIVRRGHTIALHSYTHDYGQIYSSDEAFFSDLNKISDYVYEQSGVRTFYMRFPGGSSNSTSKSYNAGIMTRLTAEVEKRGFRYYDWNVSSNDAEDIRMPADKVFEETKRESGNKTEIILLMHDAAVKDTTVEALPRIIEYYQSRGYQLLQINDDTPQLHHHVFN